MSKYAFKPSNFLTELLGDKKISLISPPSDGILNLFGQNLADKHLLKLKAFLKELNSVELPDDWTPMAGPLTDTGDRWIISNSWLTDVHTLNFGHNNLTGEHIEDLLSEMWAVRKIILTGNPVTRENYDQIRTHHVISLPGGTIECDLINDFSLANFCKELTQNEKISLTWPPADGNLNLSCKCLEDKHMSVLHTYLKELKQVRQEVGRSYTRLYTESQYSHMLDRMNLLDSWLMNVHTLDLSGNNLTAKHIAPILQEWQHSGVLGVEKLILSRNSEIEEGLKDIVPIIELV